MTAIDTFYTCQTYSIGFMSLDADVCGKYKIKLYFKNTCSQFLYGHMFIKKKLYIPGS